MIEHGNRQPVGVELLQLIAVHEKNLAETLHGLAYPLRRRLIGDEPRQTSGQDDGEVKTPIWTDQLRSRIAGCERTLTEITHHLQALSVEFSDDAREGEVKTRSVNRI